jgi:Fe-S oxidoreductase
MATYKAEFLSHYYERHRRPRTALAFGLIRHWAALGALAPDVVNFVTQTPGLRALAKLAAGMPQQRQIPRFAPFTFRQWFEGRAHPASGAERKRVVLWPDTFNNHFHPETAIAAVRTLERAGCEVVLPRRAVCCGRPLYDYGMLDTARRWLEETLDTLAPEIDAGVPVVGLEPSCVAVFRDEMRELLPAREDAKRLSRQTFLLSEYLTRERFAYPQLQRKAVVHGHCHHKAIMKFDAEEEALRAMGLDVELLDSGCCGMAGSFGFEAAHYDVSMKVGEQVLLPAVRSAPRDAIIVADGFSCRTQIAQATDRRALHLAELIELAAGGGSTLPNEEFLESRAVPSYLATARQRRRRQWLGVGMTIAALAAAALLRRRWSVSRLDALRSMDGGA